MSAGSGSSQGSSKSLPDTNNSFSFEIRPASTLKQAIAALSDSNFNGNGMGMIAVSENSFEITVRNSNTMVIGYLCLPNSGLIDFEFHKPIRSMINLNEISDTISVADKDSTISIHREVGSDKLSIKSGSIFGSYMLELSQVKDEFEKIPHISTYELECEAFLHTGNFRDLLQLVEQESKSSKFVGHTHVLVTCEVTNISISFTVQGKKLEYDYTTKKDEIKGVDLGQTRRACFNLHHTGSLKKALVMAERVKLGFTSYHQSVMWKLDLGGAGEVVYIMCKAGV